MGQDEKCYWFVIIVVTQGFAMEKKLQEEIVARSVFTYWKKEYNITSKQLRVMKEILFWKYPAITKNDLMINCDSTKFKIKKDLDVLIKTRMVNKKLKGSTIIYYLSTNGRKSLKKWEKEEELGADQVSPKQIIQK